VPGFAQRVDEIPQVTPDESQRDLIIVNHPLSAVIMDTVAGRIVDGQPLPRSTVVLAPAGEPIVIKRPDSQSLLVHTNDEDSRTHLLDLYTRSHPFKVGETTVLPAVTAVVQQVTADGRPMDVLFRFHVPLEDKKLHWIWWNQDRFEPFVPPPVGETVGVPRSSLPF
jgi:hypothetical protein